MKTSIIKIFVSRMSKRQIISLCILALCFLVIVPNSCFSDGINNIHIGGSYSTELYQSFCGHDAISSKYSGDNCWSCKIISSLMTALTDTAKWLKQPLLDLSKTILLVGTAIWIAMYFSKSLSSMAAQDPSKVLDGDFTFMFKVAFIWALIGIGDGISNVIAYIVNPLLQIGMDIGTSLNEKGGG